MNENGLNYIDLFAGAGGLSEGFIQSGYRPVAHVEMNEHAAKTIETRIAYYYLKDNGKIKSYYDYEKGKITREQLLEKIPKEELKTVINKEMSEATIKGIFNTIDDIKREKEIDKIDVIIGGPPCQASITVREAARIQSFPDNYYFEGPRTAQFIQVGNAVPPMMAKVIADKIKEQLGK